MTLFEDFDIWWKMPKYKDVEIPAKEFSDVEIKQRNGSNKGCPGPEDNVHYWVELENGMAVGIITPKKKPATFPFYRMV
jgi:hypothetical protein